MAKEFVNLRKTIRTYPIYVLGVFIVWICLCVPVCGLDRNRALDQFHHTAWTARDGAPSQITAFAQTADGYLWIGSALGLFRFDGVTFERYEPPGGVRLPSDNNYALMATPDGGLWISFRPSGLGFLKDGELKLFTRPEELPKSPVNCFARTPDGRIWAGTQNGLELFNGAGWDEIGADWNFQPNSVKTLFTDSDGTLWVSQEGSIVVLPPGSKTFQISEKIEKNIYVKQFAQAPDGRLWAAKSNFQATPIKNSTSGSALKSPVLNIGTLGLLFDRDGGLWASGNEVNHVRFPENLETGYYRDKDGLPIETFEKSDGLSDTFVGNPFEDREGNIWVSTLAGLDRFRYSTIVPIAVPELNKKMTLSANERGEIWAASAMVGSFLHLHEEQVEKVLLTTKKQSNLPPEISVASLYYDTDGSVWWGAFGGVWHQQDKGFKFFPQPGEMKPDWMWEIFRGENDGGLWVNFGDEGLIYFKDGVWERRKPPDGLPDRGPSASYEDEQKRIWLGYTENRVCFLDGGRVQCYTSANGIEIGRIKVIRGRVGNLWFGGETGLAFFKDDRFYTVKTEGKPFGAVSGIVAAENGDVWLNEVHGIVRIPADEIRRLNENPEYPVKYRLFDFQDNLPGNPQMNFTVSTAIETSDKRLWFATDNGLAMIDPAHLEKNVVPPPVVIKSVIADDKHYQIAPNRKFPAGTADVQVKYTAASLSIPERVVFKYRLEGYESGWRDAGTRREAFYTNLAPGKYRFQVIAANNDGVWNEQGASLEFEILPMFYQTSWFLLAVLAALGVLVWAAYQWRVYQMKSRLHLLYEERLSERTRIAQDLHDTLLQGFLGLTMRLQAVSNLLPAKPENAKESLDNVLDQADDVLEKGRRGIWGIRSSAVPDEGLEQAFMLACEDLSAVYPANFTVTAEGENRPLHPLVRDEVYRIGREALTNAFRHSKATNIEIGIEYAPKKLRIFVCDNGCGIDPDFINVGREGHLGLSGMREIAQKIGAELKIWSRAEGGTEVELIVPHHVAFIKKSFGSLFWRLIDSYSREKPERIRRTEQKK
jgi:signal transduction histidine kinase/ligand-binding sensor domain-containing protein